MKTDVKRRAAMLTACVTAVSVGSLLAVPAAYAEANVETGHFSTKEKCQAEGRAGLYSRAWTDYRCERVDEGGYPGGHDGPYVKKESYTLYTDVSPEAPPYGKDGKHKPFGAPG